MTNTDNRKKSIHRGHRERMKKRFRVNLGKDFQDHELLEMLLFYVLPRTNTNEVAHRLLEEFGSLRNVCNAEPSRIEKVMGAGPATATFFSLLFTIRKRIELQKHNINRVVANSAEKGGEFLLSYYKDKPYEEVCAMLLDNSLRLLEFKVLSTGSVNSSSIDIKSLTKYALTINATHVILSHNHPGGYAEPSAHDRQVSSDLASSLRAVGIVLLDHFIIGEGTYRPTIDFRIANQNIQTDPKKYRDFYST